MDIPSTFQRALLNFCAVQVLTIVLNDVPAVNPATTMQYDGAVAFAVTRAAVLDTLLNNGQIVQRVAPNRWLCNISAARFGKPKLLLCIHSSLLM